MTDISPRFTEFWTNCEVIKSLEIGGKWRKIESDGIDLLKMMRDHCRMQRLVFVVVKHCS